jgi:pimeloyl-ACP methyl ester carboxylesterase
MPHINIDGIELEYKQFVSNSASDTTLLFLHHGLGSAGLWRDFPKALSERTGLPALAYSRRGHGRSDPTDWPRPIDFLQNEAIDVVPKLLEKLGIGKVVCVGHSEGGSISLVYAATYPKRVKGIVIESAHVLVERRNLEAIAQIRNEYRTGELRKHLQRHHRDNVDCAFYGFTESWLNPEFKGWNIENYVKQVRCFVLAIHGTRDEYISREHFDRLVGLFERPAETLLLDCGHAPHEEYPDEVLDRMAQFIGSLFQ